MPSNCTLTYTANGEVKEFYCDSVYYGAKITFNQPLPKGWKLKITIEKE